MLTTARPVTPAESMATPLVEPLPVYAGLNGLLQAFPDLLLQVGADGVITAQRGRMVPALGAAPVALVGTRLHEVAGPGEVAVVEAALTRTRALGEVTTVTITRHDHGAEVVLEMRLVPLGDEAVMAVVRDVTEARRSAELRLARQEVEAAGVAKTAFLSTLSHELRTPLNAILGYSELLAEDAAPGAREDLDRIHHAGRRLLHIINAMLDIARLEAGRVAVELDAVDLTVFVADAASTARAAADAKGLTLTAAVEPGLPALVTDRAKLRQVVMTLLGNAVKFTERGRVELVVQSGAFEGRAGVVLAVRDSGIGIPADQVGRLFQDFAQIDASNTRRFGGTGLGLAISRRLCALLGGRVEVESADGIGSTFSVWLPRPAASPSSMTAGAAQAGEDAA